MAPNSAQNVTLYLKTNPDVHVSEDSVVRTEFIAHNIYSYILEGTYKIQKIQPCNSEEKIAFKYLKDLIDEFIMTFETAVTEVICSLEITISNISTMINGVSNELFNEGIEWSKIATFFVFVGELSKQCLQKDFPEYVVFDILECCKEYVKNHLQKWINDHDDWKYMNEVPRSCQKNNVEKVLCNTNGNCKKFFNWTKATISCTFRVLGTLAYIANYTDPVFTFPIKSMSDMHL